MGKRFTYGGDTAKDQRVYYINTKELGEILFGTATPIPFRVVVDESLGYKLSVDIRCNGLFTYKICDPLLFYTNVCGNVADTYESEEIAARLKGEMMTALQPALAKLSAQKIQYYEIPAHTLEISDALNEVLSSSWRQKRGIEVFSVNINSLSIPDDQRKKLTEWEENAMTTNPNTAAARLVGGQIDAMKAAAANGSGAMTGFMGMGMAMNAAGGANAQNLFAMGQQQAQPMQSAGQQTQNPIPKMQPEDTWICTKCGTRANGKFCPECGSPKPADGWICSCGSVNKGKFCTNCGATKPAGALLYKCDKCGWEPDVDPRERMEVLSFSTVSRYMVMRGESSPAVIPDEQMARFRFMLDYSEESISMNSAPLARGEKVRVIKGPLTGLVGELVHVDGKSKIAVRLNMLGCACVDMPVGYVEPIMAAV